MKSNSLLQIFAFSGSLLYFAGCMTNTDGPTESTPKESIVHKTKPLLKTTSYGISCYDHGPTLYGGAGPVGTDGTASILYPNDCMTSANGYYTLVFQTDGNLVAYTWDGRAYWATRTQGYGGNVAVMQGDGNFVVYKMTYNTDGSVNTATPLWSTGTYGHSGQYTDVTLQNDFNLVVTWQDDNGYGKEGFIR